MKKVKKKVFLRTFGWPYGEVPQDDSEGFEDGIWVKNSEKLAICKSIDI